MESVQRFLHTGRGVIWGDERERATIELCSHREFNYRTINQLVLDALDHKPITLLMSGQELYSVALIGETCDSETEISRWNLQSSERIAVGSSTDVLTQVRTTTAPPVLWDLSREARWALMEMDVCVTHAVRIETFVGIQREDLVVRAVVDTAGHVPWGYEITVGAESVTVSANALLDVVYGHETIKSAGSRLLEIAEKFLALAHG